SALSVWESGLPYFLPSHTKRFQSLVELLGAVPSTAVSESNADSSEVESMSLDRKRCKLGALCRRLSHPDMLTHFGMDLQQPPVGTARNSSSGLSLGPLSPGKHQAQPPSSSPQLHMRTNDSLESLEDGLLSGQVHKEDVMAHIRSLLSARGMGAMGGQAMEETVERMFEAVASGKSLSAFPFVGLEAEFTAQDLQQRRTQALLDLLGVLIARIERVPQAPTPSEGIESQLSQRDVEQDVFGLLAAIQHQLCQQLLSSSSGEAERRGMEFDPHRASRNISLCEGESTVTQQQNKSWGSIMVKKGFQPGSGVHKWIVHVDRCEKGHIFLGVCTGQVNVNTYVGGDGNGWGLIGTKALWHNRTKVRGDYGDGYSTGSLVTVTLDMDSGTLRFGSGEPGTLATDWGLAFEGLPKSETLFPAVGLYQKDDQVTILPCTSLPVSRVSLGHGYSGWEEPRSSDGIFSRKAPDEFLPQRGARSVSGYEQVLSYTQDLVRSVKGILEDGQALIREPEGTKVDHDRQTRALETLLANPLVNIALPAMSAALLLMPHKPVASAYLAVRLLPSITSLAKLADSMISDCHSWGIGDREQGVALTVDVSGLWRIKSAPADNIPEQEYTLNLEAVQAPENDLSSGSDLVAQQAHHIQNQPPGQDQDVLQRSFGAHGLRGMGGEGANAVEVEGSVVGLRMVFLETWKQGGMCTVEGRLSLDGDFFTGTFRDTRTATKGAITGKRISSPEGLSTNTAVGQLIRLETLVCMLVGKLMSTLITGVEADIFGSQLSGSQSSIRDMDSNHSLSPPKLLNPKTHVDAVPAVPESKTDSAAAREEKISPTRGEGFISLPAEGALASPTQVEASSPTDGLGGVDTNGLSLPGAAPMTESALALSDDEGDEVDSISSGKEALNAGSGDSQGKEGRDGGTLSKGYGSGSSGAGTALVGQQDMAELVWHWRHSQLLSGGLYMSDVWDHIQAALQFYMPNTGDKLGGDSWWYSEVFPFLAQDSRRGQQGYSGVQAKELDLDPFYEDLSVGRGEAAGVDTWVTRHLGVSPFARLGGEAMKAAGRAVSAALTLHSGSLSRVLAEYRGRTDDSAKPSSRILQVWRASRQVVEWAVRSKQISGLSFAALADILRRKANFLLRVRPCPVAVSAELSSTVMGQTAGGTVTTDSDDLEESGSELLASAVRFFESKLRWVDPLREEMMCASIRSVFRIAGMRALGLLLGKVDPGSGTNEGHEGLISWGRKERHWHRNLQLQCAATAATQYLVPAFQGHNAITLGSSVLKRIGAGWISNADNGGEAWRENLGCHYLDRLQGCCVELEADARSSFEKLYELLANHLYRSVWSGDVDAQLVLLQAWGLVIRSVDHAFLSRVGIFRTLQLVIEEARGSIEELGAACAAGERLPTSSAACRKAGASCEHVSTGIGIGDEAEVPKGRMGDLHLVLCHGGPYGARLLQAGRQRVVRSALKVVHLLAAQVAYSEDQTTPIAAVMSGGMPASIGTSVPMTRTRSGPETLSCALFDMLHSELQYALCRLAPINSGATQQTDHGYAAQKRLRVAADMDTASNETTTGRETSRGATAYDPIQSAEEDLTADQYCYRILTLVHSVSGSPVCQRFLSSPAWLRLLVGGIQVGTPVVQRRLLRLLRRLLPSVDPAGVNLDCSPPGGLLAELVLDNASSRDTRDERQFGESFVSLLLEVIGMALMPSSLADALTQAIFAESTTNKVREGADSCAPENMEKGERNCSANIDRSGTHGYISPLATESVLLLRCLQRCDMWSPLVNKGLEGAICGAKNILCGAKGTNHSGEEATANVEIAEAAKIVVHGRDRADGRIGGTHSATLPNAELELIDDEELREKEKKWTARRDRILKAIAATSIMGGFIEGLRVGGSVNVRLGATGGSDSHALRLAGMTSCDGVLVSLDREKNTAEVALVENKVNSKARRGSATGGTSPSLSSSGLHRFGGVKVPGGLPVRPERVGCEDLNPVPEVHPAFESTSEEVSNLIVSGLLGDSLPWLHQQLMQPAQCGHLPGGDVDRDVDDKVECTGEKSSDETVGQEGGESKAIVDQETKKEQSPKASRQHSGRYLLLEDLREAWRAEDQVASATLTMQSFRAATSLLCHPHPRFVSLFLGESVHGLGGSWFSALLKVAVIPTYPGGLSCIEKLEVSWLELFEKWQGDAHARAQSVLRPPVSGPEAGSGLSGAGNCVAGSGNDGSG
ncbi:unnamed protein product, partial [Discosporangium mesarthrocarpum]